MNKIAVLFATGLLAFSSCDNDDMVEIPTENFTLTIENVFEPKSFFMAGATGGIGPGTNYSFKFNAGKGHYLSLSTMLAQTNDLFYGFPDAGLALYNDNGNPVTGDVTDMIYLWDAGTEVNEEPGSGPSQAPRQTGANTGTAENSTVKLISDVNDGFVYPAVSAIINVMIAHDGNTEFTVTISNKSDMASLTSPLAPGVWVVHSNDIQLFTTGQAASADLEKLAEDGDNVDMADFLLMNSGIVSPFAPGVFAIHNDMNPIFKKQVMSTMALEALAEDGDPSGFDLDSDPTVAEWGIFLMPVSGNGAAPIFPGEKYEVSFKASPGDMLSFATMLVQSNDIFVAPEGIALFNNQQPIGGDITNQLKIWDAKTEVNEFPGAGKNQAPRQTGADTGVDETGTVEEVNDGFTYPAIADIIRVSISNN